MERAAFLLFDLIICAVEGYLYYNFCAHFLRNRYEESWKNVGVMSAGMLLLFCINHLQRSALNMLASGCICIILCVILFKDSMRKRLYIWFVSWFIMACSEFAVAGMLHLAWGENAIVVTGTPARVILSTVMMKIITLFAYRVICNNAPTPKSDQYPAIVSLFFCLPVSSFIVCAALCYMGDSLDVPTFHNLFLVFGCVLLLASNVVAFVIYDRLIQAMNQVKNYELMETKRHLEEIHYKSVNDMNEQNIAYHVFVEPGFTMMEMKPIDLISLISNLIDNAIEAAAKCKNGYVDIKMFQANDGSIVIMKFKNNYTENPVEYGGRFQTGKENPSMHGIGLRQVCQLVEQYKGYINILYEDNIFEVTISF